MNGPAGPGADARPGPPSWAPLARALEAYAAGDQGATVVVHSDLGGPRWLPVSLFFRAPSDFAPHHRIAVSVSRGRVLDVGAGAGAVALALQERGLSVTAIDPIPAAVAAMTSRGVRDARVADALGFTDPDPYDTVLMLMNGSMIAGTLAGLERLLAPGGQVLVDSTDLREPGAPEDEDEDYVGELHFQLEYDGERGPLFPQLFVDPATLARIAGRAGLAAEVLWQAPETMDADEDREEGSFLSRLTRRA